MRKSPYRKKTDKWNGKTKKKNTDPKQLKDDGEDKEDEEDDQDGGEIAVVKRTLKQVLIDKLSRQEKKDVIEGIIKDVKGYSEVASEASLMLQHHLFRKFEA